MFYAKDVTVATGNTINNPTIEWIRVYRGVIHRASVLFPAGTAGTIHVKVFHGNHQIYPTNLEADFNSDDEAIEFNDHYDLFPGNNLIKVVAWADAGNTYSHTVTLRLGILTEEEITLRDTLTKLTNAIEFLSYKFRSLF